MARCLLTAAASRRGARALGRAGFRSGRTQAQELWLTSLFALQLVGPSWIGGGTFLDRRWNPRLQPWQADSLPLRL